MVAFQRCEKINDPESFKKTLIQRMTKFPRMRSHICKLLGKFWYKLMPE